MDPRKLLYLAAVIENGSLKKAAKQLEISQPALSTSMDRLEQSLGGQLLKRSSAGVSPTPLGELLYAHARLIKDELDLAEKRVKDGGDINDRAIAFGALPSLATSIVPKAVCRWRETHTEATLRVTEKIQLELLLSLVRSELEFIIAQTECYGYWEGLKQRVLFRDRLYVIGRPDHPAFQLSKVTWASLACFPWVVQMYGRHRTLLETQLASEGADLPKQLTECGSVGFIKSLVANSNSLAMLPASAVEADVRAGKIRPIDISGSLLYRDIAVIFRERCPLSEAARNLVAEIETAGLQLSNGQIIPERKLAIAS